MTLISQKIYRFGEFLILYPKYKYYFGYRYADCSRILTIKSARDRLLEGGKQ